MIAGFQGVNDLGEITTLGRGGSDTSAVALAAALEADECEICTDVEGVYTTDPRIVDGARRLQQITFEEMLELASKIVEINIIINETLNSSLKKKGKLLFALFLFCTLFI